MLLNLNAKASKKFSTSARLRSGNPCVWPLSDPSNTSRGTDTLRIQQSPHRHHDASADPSSVEIDTGIPRRRDADQA